MPLVPVLPGFCACGPRDVVVQAGDVERAACAKSEAGDHCCLGKAFGAGALCFCSSLECTSDQIEVTSCTGVATGLCGEGFESVASCS